MIINFKFLDKNPQIRVISSGNEAVCNNCSYSYLSSESYPMVTNVTFNETTSFVDITLDKKLPNDINSIEILIGDETCIPNDFTGINILCEFKDLHVGNYKIYFTTNFGGLSFKEDQIILDFEIKINSLSIINVKIFYCFLILLGKSKFTWRKYHHNCWKIFT